MKGTATNVVSTVLPASLVTEDDREPSPLKAAVGNAFTPLTAFGFMVFVLLYL